MQLAAALQAAPLAREIVAINKLIADLTIIQGDGSYVADSPTIHSTTPEIGPDYKPVVPALTAEESAPLFAAYLEILMAKRDAAQAALDAL